MKNPFIYAIKNLWLSKWVSLVAVLSMGVCFLIITIVAIGLYNLNILSKKLSNKAAVVIYLREGTPQSQITQFIDSLKMQGIFSKIQFISKEEALKEMKDLIEPSLTEIIGYNPLSDTIEAFIKEEQLNNLDNITKELKKTAFVEDVYYPTKIIYTLKTLKVTFWNLGIVIFSLLGLSISFMIYVTVKNHYWKKGDEIEILKLLGATPSYIRFPFLVEGGLLGFSGALIATLSIFLIYFILYSNPVMEFMPAISNLVLPIETFFVLPLSGFILGIISAFLALGKIKYQ